MISEKALQTKSSSYATAVVRLLISGGPRAARWDETRRILEAAYFNGFQSGVVWQKNQPPKNPYVIVTTKVNLGRGRKADMDEARTPDGHFIGEPRFAEELVRKYGIFRFELRTPKSSVCSVGFSPKKKKWYGWSHRAIAGFKTRAAAARFAESVS